MKPEVKNPATMRRCFTYLVNLVLRAPAPLSLNLYTSPKQLLSFAEEYSEWHEGVMVVREAAKAKQAEGD